MSDKNLKDNYSKKVQQYQPKPNYFLNCLKAFIIGGLICTFGQLVQNFYIRYFDFTKEDAGNPTVSTLVLIAVLLTAFGVYDRIGQFAGAGSAVPVTGFANSMASAAIEHRSEGIVLGIATNMFKLAGNVIVFGVTAAYIVGLIRYIFQHYLMHQL
ncbi:stage V sporulation protein AC [Priestia endophytica]|jgi:stage V sporulation protein AC|uniref:stage V sporulation protein AC n=1 Tax=Priestia endophytica TaxID=135735 RepID=UPI00203E568B|nr:stage V sporulation protein AC [Priestia endophytica]MCM3539478.1 stage V sporulation protein AC [Priestia endophytica]